MGRFSKRKVETQYVEREEGDLGKGKERKKIEIDQRVLCKRETGGEGMKEKWRKGEESGRERLDVALRVVREGVKYCAEKRKGD